MNKKAQEVHPPSLIVAIVIVLVILLILLFVVGRESGNFFGFLDNSRQEILSSKCQSALLGRDCYSNPNACETANPGFECVPARAPPGETFDCNRGSCFEIRRK